MKWILFGLALFALMAYQLGALSVKASLAMSALKLCLVLILLFVCLRLAARVVRGLRGHR